ncbi:MAG TPA: DUF779 domain-containing protein [Solirubrobacteraceae bacterium]|nr:DUF779 domain-containing protein [Solirubrobacteraceae bacterium]
MSHDRVERDVVVAATPAALEVIHDLSAAHGPLMFFQSAGCCDGGSPICLKAGELPLGPHDIRLGEIAGAPFYIDAQQYESWGKPNFTIEVSPGAAEGFSLEGLEGVHFVTLTR